MNLKAQETWDTYYRNDPGKYGLAASEFSGFLYCLWGRNELGIRVLSWAVVWQLRHKKVDPFFHHWSKLKEIFQNLGHFHFSLNRNEKKKEMWEIDNMQMRFMAIWSISNNLLFVKYWICNAMSTNRVHFRQKPQQKNKIATLFNRGINQSETKDNLWLSFYRHLLACGIHAFQSGSRLSSRSIKLFPSNWNCRRWRKDRTTTNPTQSTTITTQ